MYAFTGAFGDGYFPTGVLAADARGNLYGTPQGDLHSGIWHGAPIRTCLDHSVTAFLKGFSAVTLAPNVPGPGPASRMHEIGASVLKLESPAGDMLASIAPTWYAELHRGIAIKTLDLKTESGRDALDVHRRPLTESVERAR